MSVKFRPVCRLRLLADLNVTLICNGGRSIIRAQLDGPAEAGSADDYWLEPISVGVTPISSGTINLLSSYANLVPLVSGAPQALYINTRNEIPIIMPNCEAIWIPENPVAAIPDSWFMRPDCEITPNVLGSRLDAAGDVVRLVRNPANNQLITLEGGTFFDEFDLSRDNNTLDVAAFHPDDGDMIISVTARYGIYTRQL